ncbi:Predicted Fe2+/Mn2+ transporter, VIT1/CCC1 family [Pseudarcicella hirudinis]|uniref:Predicted Fe2+/Mn2+ transporter, VIT1/CCC1 family n=1 Tax=Pseudarcicella hirudinis TaxID=1079859 RepID=A0A1I5VB12_9BACT|nr:VIT1/CCC1 transporter family protein [Pseudarcicella hirudinis]SFQ04718.1 Predicted Fe2+/Mn2+ transporter, VIT1/CCC1 family [Pseudarcicella hirudinis]
MNQSNHFNEQHLESSDFITDIVIGMSDGLTVPFALAAGLSGAVASTTIVTTAGIAEIVAGSIAMGLGGYLAGKTEQEHYDSELKREFEEVETVPDKEKEEVREIFAHYGLDSDAQKIIVEALAKDKKKWVDFMMKFELGLEKPDVNRARNSALTIGIAYIVGGIIPLSPYFLVDHASDGLKYSALITILTLFIFGYFKSKLTGQNPVLGALKVTAIGAVAAGAAFFVAKIIGA